MNKQLARVRELVFPNNVSLSADFPWDRSVLRTFGVLFVAILAVFLAPIVPMIALFFAGGLLSVAIPGLEAFVTAHQMFFGSILEVLMYATGFGAAIWYLWSRIPGRSLSELVSFTLQPVGGKLKDAQAAKSAETSTRWTCFIAAALLLRPSRASTDPRPLRFPLATE